MNYKIPLVVISIVMALMLVSCIVTSRDIHVEISCDDFAENPTGTRNDFEIEVGDKSVSSTDKSFSASDRNVLADRG